MDNDTAAYMNDVRKYETILEKDPSSYCFAPLSDVYRKMGRLDDALEIALKGCEMHPGYLGGYMALGRACFEKGLFDESRQALEKVVTGMPDNLLAHRLLCQVYRAVGDEAGVRRSETVVRSLTDEEELPPLPSPAVSGGMPALEERGEEVHDDDILELTEILELEEAEPEAVSPAEDLYGDDLVESIESRRADPFSTVTIAELCVSQGHADRALAIYHELLAADPGNEDIQQRIDALTPGGGAEPALAVETGVSATAAPDRDDVLATLEGWLANIRRRR